MSGLVLVDGSRIAQGDPVAARRIWPMNWMGWLPAIRAGSSNRCSSFPSSDPAVAQAILRSGVASSRCGGQGPDDRPSWLTPARGRERPRHGRGPTARNPEHDDGTALKRVPLTPARAHPGRPDPHARRPPSRFSDPATSRRSNWLTRSPRLTSASPSTAGDCPAVSTIQHSPATSRCSPPGRCETWVRPARWTTGAQCTTRRATSIASRSGGPVTPSLFGQTH